MNFNKLEFSEYNSDKYIEPPPRALNGGLYTGEEFKKGSQYGNVPVIPDTGYMIHYNLRSANPPPGAIYQYPGTTRPGNNYNKMIGIVQNEKYNIQGTEEKCCNNVNNKNENTQCDCPSCVYKSQFSKYYYY
jgi:hypothetical protein